MATDPSSHSPGDTGSSPAAGQRVLCYSPYNIWPLHGMWEITILHALRLRGAELKYVLCDGLYSDCDVFRKAANPRHGLACSECRALVTALMHRMGVAEYEWLGRYLTPDEIEKAHCWEAALDRDALLEATHGDFPVAKWIRSSVHTHLRIRDIDLADSEHEATFRSYLRSGLIACFGLTRLLDTYRPHVLFLFNGRMSSTRVALELANRRGVRVVCHERGRRWENLGISVNGPGENPGTFDTVKRIFADWKDVPLTADEIRVAGEHMNKRAHGMDLPWDAFSHPPVEAEALRARYGLSPDRPLWALFTSSEDELLDYLIGAIPTQAEWIERTIAFARAHPEIDLLIRIHPIIAGKKATGQSLTQLKRFRKLCADLPPNAHMIEPDDPISSYSIMDLAAVGLVFFSSVGLEMACRGKAVIGAARSLVSDADFVRTVERRDAYESLLEDALTVPAGHVDRDVMRRAFRYAYAYYYRFSIPFPLIRMTDKTHGEPLYDSGEALKPGADSHLDRICGILLAGDPVCKPPGPEERARTDRDERDYFGSKSHAAPSGGNAGTTVTNRKPAPCPSSNGKPSLASDPRRSLVEAPEIRAVPKTDPKVSVLVSAYNYARYVGACLDSVKAQTFRNIEVIVLDDHSSDGTFEAVKPYLKDPRFRAVRNLENLGQPRTCNKGLRMARGEYVCFLHADDVFEPANLERKTSLLDRRRDLGMVYSGLHEVDGDGSSGPDADPSRPAGTGITWETGTISTICCDSTISPLPPARWCAGISSPRRAGSTRSCPTAATGRSG